MWRINHPRCTKVLDGRVAASSRAAWGKSSLRWLAAAINASVSAAIGTGAETASARRASSHCGEARSSARHRAIARSESIPIAPWRSGTYSHELVGDCTPRSGGPRSYHVPRDKCTCASGRCALGRGGHLGRKMSGSGTPCAVAGAGSSG